LLHGENDATGLCTIRLITVLQEAHNQVFQTLQHFSSLGAHTAAAADVYPPGETTLLQYGRRIHHPPSPVPDDEEFDKAEDAQDVYEQGGKKKSTSTSQRHCNAWRLRIHGVTNIRHMFPR
jgi:hypothetical protein